MKVRIVKTYELYDLKTNEFFKVFNTLEEALSVARAEKGMGVDVNIAIENADGESLISSGDAIFSMQVYPEMKDYDNYPIEVSLIEQED